MKASETSFLEFLKGPKQYIIPIYQRTYSWTQRQCKQLWQDVERTGKDDKIPAHFLGSIVYIQRGLYQATAIPQLLVIDGQQRLATLTLLLAALGRAIDNSPDTMEMISLEEVQDYYLFNRHGKGDRRYILLLTQSDKPTLIKLLEGKRLPKKASPLIVENYRYFEDAIAKSGVDLMTIYRGILKLVVVDISLDANYDNPQLIFESLNSTGLELTQADLIRNYVLMGLETDHQEALYTDHWYPMEQSFGQVGYTKLFDRFMRDYLTIKTGRIPNIRQVYEAFKTYQQTRKDLSIDEIVADIRRYSEYFVAIALEREKDRKLRRSFANINGLRVDVAYPFLLEVYDDYVRNTLSRDDFAWILRYIESYVFRRAVCGIPTNSLNKTFATLSRDLDKRRYLESFSAAMILKDSYRRFPDNQEFKRDIILKDLYNFRSRNYWLRRMENHHRKEKVEVQEYTVEHVMPQNPALSTEWREELGENWREVHARYLHTLGNLTLTGYNPELSDRPFAEKRDIEGGFADSPVRLNRSLANEEHWNEAAILNRARDLAQRATVVWPYPNPTAATLDKYKTAGDGRGATYTLADHANLTGHLLDLFQQVRRRLLHLDPSVTEDIRKYYIAYKTSTNFVDIVAQKSRLLLVLNMRFDEIEDPQGLCRDVTGKGKWGNGDVEIRLNSPSQIDPVMELVHQSFELYADNGED